MRAIISFKVISWYEVTLLLSVESIFLWHPRAELSKYAESQLQLSLFLSCYCAVDVVNRKKPLLQIWSGG